MSLRHFDARKDLLKPQRNLIYLSEEKSLRHVAVVAKILDDNKQNKPLKSLFALFQTSAILVVALAQEARLIICNAFFAPARWGGGGDRPLFRLFRYVPRQRVCFFRCFGLKEGINFDHFGLK